MALVLATLQSGLLAVFQSMPPTGAQAAQAMADAYVDYASAAQFGGGTVEFPSGSAPLLAALTPAMIPAGSQSSFGAAWAAGLAALWTPATAVVVGGSTGTVIGCPGSGAAAGAITGVVSSIANTAATAAAGIAAALDTATKTVTATVIPPPSGVIVPIV